MRKILFTFLLFIFVLVGTSMESWSADSHLSDIEFTCIEIEKEVSVDGGMTWRNADTMSQAPCAQAGAEYRFIVKNCGTVDLSNGRIWDAELDIDVTSHSKILKAGKVVVFTRDDPGFENLDQPDLCAFHDPGEILNTVRVRAHSVQDFKKVHDKDSAWVQCDCITNEGCSLGYWKQPHHFYSWTVPFTPDMLFSDVFEDAFPDLTLLDVLRQGGGGLNSLGRHTVAALLNAASPEVDFYLSVDEVISRFNDVFPGTKRDYESLKELFENFNEQGCPLK